MKRSLLLAGAIVPLAAYAYACGNDGGSPGTTPEAGALDAPASSDGDVTDTGVPIPDAGAPDTAPVACANRNPLKNPYFGDLHAHTSYSFDAFTFDTRNTPMDAYAFAKGKTVQVAGAGPDGGGPLTTIERPLDFLAVTDHSEWLALAYGCGDTLAGAPQGTPKSPYYDTPTCALFRSTNPVQQAIDFAGAKAMQAKLCGDAGYDCTPVIQSAWQSEQAAAAAAYEPCKFTSLVAYEYTRSLLLDAGAATLHKNVVFGSDKVPAQPIDAFNFPTQVDLWTALDQQCLADAGCQAITIPHNSNLSQGAAFVAAAGAEAQMVKYQRLVEIFQHKGGSECFYDPQNPTDPTCNFEYLGAVTEPNLPRSYVRTALKEGIVQYATTKVNALQMGIVAATDDHNGAPGNTRESTWPGHAGRLDDTPQQRIGLTRDGGDNGVSHGHNPGGLAVVWAEQNTRDSIFSALYRRETYGTSGTRIVVRFYQTWDVAADPCADPQFPAQLVAGGAVPMGGNMAAAPGPAPDGAPASPRFVVYAWKDQTELARIDLIKAWVDAAGQAQEKVIAFPLTAGAPACVTWTDPEFTATASFYYARVLEQPTDRWSVQDCKADPTANPAGCADGGYLNTTIQERAWTSPIWWMP
jgi:Protein of unknown function (DUF3604)